MGYYFGTMLIPVLTVGMMVLFLHWASWIAKHLLQHRLTSHPVHCMGHACVCRPNFSVFLTRGHIRHILFPTHSERASQAPMEHITINNCNLHVSLGIYHQMRTRVCSCIEAAVSPSPGSYANKLTSVRLQQSVI